MGAAYKYKLGFCGHQTIKPAMASSSLGCARLLILFGSCLLLSVWGAADYGSSSPHPVKGLSWSFYRHSCPRVESIIRSHLKKVFKKDIGNAAGLLRLHFHDCFVQGCDASVLLDGTKSNPGEQEAPPNLTLRAAALQIIDDLRELIDHECGAVVSCADILTIAARDSVHLSGGPDYDVPLGRRDSLDFASRAVTIANLPSSTTNATALIDFLATKNLDATDLVALSGGHTIGRSHCPAFTGRLYPTQDPTMDETLADDLKQICPASNTDATTNLDIRTPNHFDNKYYVNLVNRQGLFTSDQDLYSYRKTRWIVRSFAEDEVLFNEKFVHAMLKMGQISVLTGNKGEIRANCSVKNPKIETLVGDQLDKESAAEL